MKLDNVNTKLDIEKFNDTLNISNTLDNTIIAQNLSGENNSKPLPGTLSDLEKTFATESKKFINQMPAGVRQTLQFLQKIPPDVHTPGVVVDVPAIGKIGLFILQPSKKDNAFIPDFGKKPILFFSIPAQNIVGTFNTANGQIEFGPGGTKPIAPQTLVFYNERVGGQFENPVMGKRGIPNVKKSSVSVNFGILNSTVTDPIIDYGIDVISKGVTNIVRALQVAGLAGDAVTFPSGEGVVGAIGAEALRIVVLNQIKNRTSWFYGVGWRGADYVTDNTTNEVVLNISGAKFRLERGSSTRPSSEFILDLSTIPSGLTSKNIDAFIKSMPDISSPAYAKTVGSYADRGSYTPVFTTDLQWDTTNLEEFTFNTDYSSLPEYQNTPSTSEVISLANDIENGNFEIGEPIKDGFQFPNISVATNPKDADIELLVTADEQTNETNIQVLKGDELFISPDDQIVDLPNFVADILTVPTINEKIDDLGFANTDIFLNPDDFSSAITNSSQDFYTGMQQTFGANGDFSVNVSDDFNFTNTDLYNGFSEDFTNSN